MTPFIVSLLVKVTLLLSLGLIASASLRRFGPSFRHQVLLVTIGSCLLLPVFIALTPRWDVGVLPSVATPGFVSNALGSPAVGSDRRLSAQAAQPSVVAANRSNAAAVWIQRASLPLAWAIGFVAVLIWLAAGRIRLRRIANGSWSLTGSDWERALEEESREAGVTKPVRLLSSSVVSTPLTWGSRSPIILLPEDALDWPDAHRRIVLRHELAHVARGDALSQLVAGFVCALYWFHPLVWIAERRLRAECERACDDRVVALGTPAPEYASHLLEVARSARSFGAPGFLSVAMARPSQLEGRLLAVLNESGRRAAPSPRARTGGLLVALLIVGSVSAFRAVPRLAPPAHKESTPKEAIVVETKPVSDNLPIARGNPRAPVASLRAITRDSTFQRSAPARDGGTLTLDLRTGGQVNITGWDKQQVLVQASLGGRDWRNTDVTLTPVEGGARLATEYTGGSSSQSFSHNFDIHVPRSFNVKIRSAGGGVTINGVDGYFTGNTGGGEIEIRKANGKAEIKTGGGDIRVSDSRLTGSVSTGGGKIMIERVSGNFSGYSGSGPVTYINSDGGIKSKNGTKGTGSSSSATNEPVYVVDGVSIGIGVGSGRSVSVKKGTTTTTYVDDGVGQGGGFGASGIRMSSAGGDISLPEAPDGARVTTGGGAVRIGPSAGEVYASTGGGLINIGPASGSVEAHTGAGNVTITLTGAGSHSVDVTSGKGEVVLVVPRDLSATLELESAYTNNLGHETRIESDWPLTVTSTKDWDSSEGTPRKYVWVRQTIGGGGGVIRVRTVNGNVVLRRSN
jgi:beta-lactamase regulating signal transducer with metallopeptidase domain